jgi:hypothetical protein
VIVDLYQGEPLDRILSFDAKPQINARHRLHPILPTAPGRPVRYEHEYNTRRPHRALSQAAPLCPLPTASPTWTSSGSSDVTAQEA